MVVGVVEKLGFWCRDMKSLVVLVRGYRFVLYIKSFIRCLFRGCFLVYMFVFSYFFYYFSEVEFLLDMGFREVIY